MAQKQPSFPTPVPDGVTTDPVKIRERALYEAAAAVMRMEDARVDQSWGTVVRKVDARDTIVALIDYQPSPDSEPRG